MRENISKRKCEREGVCVRERERERKRERARKPPERESERVLKKPGDGGRETDRE